MKRIRIWTVAALLLLLVMAAGCANKEETGDGLRFEYSRQPNVEQDYVRAREAWNWFYVEELPREDEPVLHNGQEYFKVKHDQLKTKENLETYLGFLFSDDIVSDMLADSPYTDVDGALCVLPGDHTDEIKTKLASGAAVKDDGAWKYTVTVDVVDPYDDSLVYETKETDYLYEKVDGHWLFTSFPEPSGPNGIKQADMRNVGGSMNDIKSLLRTVVKAFQKNDYDTLLNVVRDDSVHDKSTLESYRNLVVQQFGNDAWLNTSYIISDLTEPVGDYNVCKVALTFNGQSTSALGYRDFYFYITDQFGPWKVSDVSSFSFDPYYGGESKPPYFFANEASYGGVAIRTTEKELQAKLGAPVELEEDEAAGTARYVYKDAEYLFYRTDQAESGSILGQITVYSGTNETIRGIKLGDSFETAVKEFPIEKDYKQEPIGRLFGKDTIEGQGGYLDDDVLIVSSENITPSVKIEFLNGAVNRIHYMLIPQT